MPGVDSHVVFPEHLSLKVEALLLWDLECGDGLPWLYVSGPVYVLGSTWDSMATLTWILFWVPHLSDVLDGLVFEVLAQLDLEQVFGVVLVVEVLQPSV